MMDETRDRQEEADWFETQGKHPLFRLGSHSARGRFMTDTVLVLLAVVIVPAGIIVFGIPLLEALGITEESAPAAVLSIQTGLNFLGFLLVGVGYLYWRGDRSLVDIRRPTLQDSGLIVVGVVGLVGLMLGLEALFNLLDIEMAENQSIERGREHPELFLLFIPIQFLLTGPGEELIFRGIIQGLARRAYGIVPGVIVASVLFALFHLPALGTGVEAAPVLLIIFLSGLFLGALYEYAGTLLVPILVHALWNALVFGTLYLDTVGMLIG